MKGMIRAAAMAFLLAACAEDYDAGLEAYDDGDYETAYETWRPLAERGNAKAQSKLGRLYFRGRGVAQDYDEAARWFRAAAEQGQAGAQSHLGVMYRRGEGVIQDYATAHMWFNIASAIGTGGAAERARDSIADRMTPEAIAEAQRRARLCMESGYQDCE